MAMDSVLRQAIDRYPLMMAPETPLMDVLKAMPGQGYGADYVLAVVQEQLVGIFTSKALIPLLVAQCDLATMTLAEVMVPPVAVHEADLANLATLLAESCHSSTQYLPVLNDRQQVVGVLPSLQVLPVVAGGAWVGLEEEVKQAEDVVQAWGDVQRTQTALQQSQQRYQRLVNSLRGIVWEADPETIQFSFVSPQAETILGYPVAEWYVPNFWVNHLYGEDRPIVYETCRQATLSQQDHDLEYRMVAANGGIVWIYDTVRIVKDSDGFSKLVGFMMETTHQQQIQAQLHEQERVYRVLVENSPDIIERFDTQLRHLYVSPLLLQLTGLSAGAFLGKSCRDMDMAEPMVSTWECAAQRLLATGEKQLIEFETPTVNGIRSFEMAIAPELTHDRMIESILCISRDVTERKRTEAALREQQQFTEQIAETTLAILYIYDLQENRNVYVNSQVAAILGYSPAEIQAMGHAMFATLLHPDDLVGLNASFQKCLTAPDGGMVETEYRMRHQQGGYRWLLSRDRVLTRTAEGVPRQVLGVATDITLLKETQMALQQQAERERLVGAIAQRVRQSLNLETILTTTVAEVRQFLQTDRVIIYRFQSNWSGVVVAESVGEAWLSILNQEITDTYFVETQGKTYHQGTINATEDVLTAGFNPCHVALMQQLQVRAKLIVPILQGHHLWGLLVAHHCAAPRPWHAWEGELLSQLATQVGIAIQQASLYQQAQLELAERQRAEIALQSLNRDLEQRVQERTEALLQQANQERLLRFVTQRIHQSFHLEEVLATVLAETRQTLEVNRVALYRFNPDWSGSFVAESVEVGWVPLVGPTIRRVWEDTHLQVTQGGRYRHHKTFSVHDIYAVGFTRCHIDLLEQFQARAFAIAPIFVQDTLWGLLAAYQNAEPRHWLPGDMELLQQISVQTAIAIRQSELYTQLENELRQKEVLLKEVHHRVKNNLQVISSLLNLQSASIENPDVLQLFLESQRRISVMALIHERLYRSANLAQLNFADYIRELVDDVFQSYLPIGLTIDWDVHVANLYLQLDLAIPCGLIVNELVSNAIKYAYPDQSQGHIFITFEAEDAHYSLTIRDDGVGFPADLDFQNTESLGMQVVCALTRQLGGYITLNSDNGTQFTITF